MSLPTARRLAGAALALSFACSAFVAGATSPSSAQEPPITLTKSIRDFDGDDAADTLAVVMSHGRAYDDTRAWCGKGEKYEGDFLVRVRLADGTATEHRLGSYEFFRSGEWEIAVADYDHDGRPDFNLGQYAGCNGWRYDLYTVDASGRVRPLPTTGGSLPVSDHANSTDRIVPTGVGFEHCYYTQRAGHVVEAYRWHREREIFVSEGQRLVEGCP